MSAATNAPQRAPISPLSGQPMRPWLHVPVDCVKREPNRFAHVFWCERSGYGRIHPLPRPGEVAALYDLKTYYTQGDSQFAQGGPPSLLDRVRDHLAWRLDSGIPLTTQRVQALIGEPSAEICDIGCGSGRLAGGLAELGHRVTAVELDPSTVASKHRNRIELLQGSAEQLPAAARARRFDLVVLSHVLEHCLDPLRALRNVRSVLKPSGLLLCEVPNSASAGLRRSGAAWAMLDVPRHLHFFTQRSLRGFCEQVGLRVESVYYAHYSRQFSNAWVATERMLRDALLGGAAGVGAPPPANSKLRAWTLLGATLLARDEIKYDSVGVIARPR
jgi:2-polyprenyl-3-methyl-5-hydroxy-6-metoxy-1,4-benzoquinol methylase